MMRRAFGTALLFILIVGLLSGGVIWIAFDVTSFDEFVDVLKSLWSTFLEILSG